jgi:hypothetical protein
VDRSGKGAQQDYEPAQKFGRGISVRYLLHALALVPLYLSVVVMIVAVRAAECPIVDTTRRTRICHIEYTLIYASRIRIKIPHAIDLPPEMPDTCQSTFFDSHLLGTAEAAPNLGDQLTSVLIGLRPSMKDTRLN